MHTAIRFTVPILALLSRTAVGQFPTPQSIRALPLDSIGGVIPVYSSLGVARAEAVELQALMTGCVAKYRDSIPVLPKIELAILDSAAWLRATALPYGIPTNNAAEVPVVVLVPATAAKMFLTGIGTDQPDRFFHLLALHELGHILMFATIGVDRRSGWDEKHFPAWYLELTATSFGLSCVFGRPADYRLLRGTADSVRVLPRPSFTGLDQFSEVLTTVTADGVPYLSTPSGVANFAWYQRLLSESAGRSQERLGLGLVPLLREQWGRKGPVTTADIVKDLSRSDPGLISWLQGFGAIP